MKNDNLDDIFNDDKLMKDIKKGKRKSLVRTIIVSMVIIFMMYIGNAFISIKIGEESTNKRNSLVRLSVPNGYISSAQDTIGILGGTSTYKISKYIGNKSVIVEDDACLYGLSLPGLVARNYGIRLQQAMADKYPTMVWTWSDTYRWKNGYRKMRFYHPDLQYKDYSKDFNILDDLSKDKLIEIAVSFDKKYKINEIENIIPNVNRSWYWLDAFTEEEMKNYKDEIEKNKDNTACIREGEVVGINSNKYENPELGIFKSTTSDILINNLLDSMKNSSNKRYNNVYNELMRKGYKDSSSMPVLGVIVYGTKDELKSLKGNPHIKATSVGVITDRY